MGSSVNKKAIVEVGTSEQLTKMVNEKIKENRKYLIAVDVYKYPEKEEGIDIELEIKDLEEHYDCVLVYATCDTPAAQCNMLCPWYDNLKGC